MRSANTSLGGPQEGFPETTAGVGRFLHEPGSPEYQAYLARLCGRYWKPVYGYVRVAWRKSNEDAKDLTQAFFLWLLDNRVLARFDQTKGGFRGFLKVILRRFVGHEEAALHRLKRGGGVDILPLDGAGGELLADPDSRDPDQVFESVWRSEILNRAVARVKERSREGPRAVPFQVYEAYDLVSLAERPTYKDLAARLGLREQDVKNHLFAVREEVRQEILSELAQGAGTEHQLKEDWDALFGA